MNITHLDSDSLDLILSYCPNSGSYELQSMKQTCSDWFQLFSGLTNSDPIQNSSQTISKTIKESFGNSNLMKKVMEMYLPRLYFNLSVPIIERDDDIGVNDNSMFGDYIEEFKKIFGDSVRIVSDNVLEIEFEMQEKVLEDVENVIVKHVAVTEKNNLVRQLNDRSIEVEPLKLYYTVKKIDQEETKLKKHISLIDLYNNWKNQPIMDSQMKVNPYRLYKKFILHIRFIEEYRGNFSNESSIIVRRGNPKGIFLPKYQENHINTIFGTVDFNFKHIYMFKKMDGMESVGVIRIIVYHMLRNKLIPLMDETQIDLKKIFNKDLLNDVKLLKDEDLVYFLIIRENILKRYRDGILSGRIKFQEFKDSKFKYKVNCSTIPEFLNFIGLETLNNHQRGKLFKKLIKHIYKSQVELSDEALDEYFQRLKVPAREQLKITHETNHSTISFERILFERETYTISHHVVSFPSFPSTNIEKIKETTDESLSWLTKKGKIDHCWTNTCCLSSKCGICNICAIFSCWCATSCCCYSTSLEEDAVKCMQGCGMPKWIGKLTNFVCCYRHRLFPVLDCSHMFDLCFSLSDDSTIRTRYAQLYSKLESKPTNEL